MRIVGGDFSGRRFNPPSGIPARPTTDVAKEGLFNTLRNMIDLEGIRTCEIFGGTGNISYELASRGVAELTVIERDQASINFIKKTATELGIADKMKIIRGDVFKFLKSCRVQYDFIFADPPYALDNMDEIPVIIREQHMLADDGIFIMEHTSRNNYENSPGFIKTKNYGTTIFTFFGTDNPQ